MTIEQKLLELSRRPQLSREEKQLLFDVVVALRAGQAMRSSFKITPETEDESASASKVDFASLGEAGIAWDAATAKGEEK
jgi:hypothetical protein